METGTKVYVESDAAQGWATVMDIFPGEIWPIQVEFDDSYDDSGHRILRVAAYEIKQEPAQDDAGRFIARVARPRKGYNVGDEYIITKPKPNGYYDVYLMDGAQKGPIGSYITDFFEVIGPFIETKTDDGRIKAQEAEFEAQPVLAPMVLPEVAAAQDEPAAGPQIEVVGFTVKKKQEKAKKKSKMDALEDAGQLSIFDFLN